MQLVKVPDSNLHLYYKKGRVGDDPNAQEQLEEWKDVNGAVKAFVRLFEEVTGNDFEPWEREKKFQKKPLKFYPIDMVRKKFCFSPIVLEYYFFSFHMIFV